MKAVTDTQRHTDTQTHRHTQRHRHTATQNGEIHTIMNQSVESKCEGINGLVARLPSALGLATAGFAAALLHVTCEVEMGNGKWEGRHWDTRTDTHTAHTQ